MKLTIAECSVLAEQYKDRLIGSHGLKAALRVAVLLYEKVCATEKRLREKYPDEYPEKKIPPIPELLKVKRKRGRPRGSKNKCYKR